METEEVAAIEYAVVRALKNFDTIEGSESQALIRLALRQGRILSRTNDEKSRLDSLAKSASNLIDSANKVLQAWEEVNKAVAKLQETYGSSSVRQTESISTARMRFENYLGRSSGLTDILEGVLQEIQDADAQKIIDMLNQVRDHEKKMRQSGPQ
ncbi:MAG: hypothetical protein OEV21_07005 [Thermoplasmata archaeon]|nr:hypothetical protein [Thermoplasmata archaeon]